MTWLVDEDCPQVRRHRHELEDTYDIEVADLLDEAGQWWCETHVAECTRCAEYHRDYAVDDRLV